MKKHVYFKTVYPIPNIGMTDNPTGTEFNYFLEYARTKMYIISKL